MQYLTNERYHVLTARQGESVTWNGHTWGPAYQCEVVRELRHPQFSRTQQRLTCGHWCNVMDRFCPHCGRAIVVRV